MTPAIEVSNLRFSYDGEAVLDGISFQVAANEAVALAGANGSGKSTLLWCLAGLLNASGRVMLFGQPPSGKLLTRVGLVFQNPEDQLFMPNLVQDLALPLVNAGAGREKAEEQARARLRELGLDKLADRPASHLSLGQRKRAAVALALVRSPELLIMDEPTAELDGRAVRQLSEMLLGLKVARLIASHDLRFLRTVTTRTLILASGRVLADGRTDELLADEDLLRRAELL
jgi:cobalt/nickel transport system ATP-binding protein